MAPSRTDRHGRAFSGHEKALAVVGSERTDAPVLDDLACSGVLIASSVSAAAECASGEAGLGAAGLEAAGLGAASDLEAADLGRTAVSLSSRFSLENEGMPLSDRADRIWSAAASRSDGSSCGASWIIRSTRRESSSAAAAAMDIA
eukprot:scaffold35173_cov63-Phaeocystis_antarctica.AAC.3